MKLSFLIRSVLSAVSAAILLSAAVPVQAAQTLPGSIRVGQSCSCATCSTVVTVSMETYVKRVLPAEWISSWNAESLKAGSIAIRSYGAYYAYHPISASYDICDNTCCQVFGASQYTSTDNAVNATAGTCMVDSVGNIMRTEYSAENNNSGSCGDCNIINNPAGPCLSDSVCCGTTTNGHGRGMCQWGTQRWAANQGKLFDWITDHYYSGFGWTRQTLSAADVICRNIASGNITDTGATITWTTNVASNSTVEYGTTTAYGSSATDAAMVTNHSVTLSGLSSGVMYHYRVKSTNAAGSTGNSGDNTFATGQIIIDNPAAVVAGSWSTGTTAGDRYGVDYRYRGQAAATEYVQYTPNVANAGPYEVYEWHPQGTNRSVGTPYVITHSGGSNSVAVNQQINGGRWNLLGEFNFAAGTAGHVRVTAAIPDAGQLALADAVKFVPTGSPPPPTPPAAPSGLSATAVSSSQINLSWADNSNNEDNFVVARSVTAGGPYNDIITLPAGTTSYNNTGLAASTTYYYVVRAVNGGGASANSNEAAATTQAAPSVPAAPSNLAATAVAKNQVNLTWSDNSNNEDNFVIEYKKASASNWTTKTVGANTTANSVTGLTRNTTYNFRVKATNAAGSSAYSNTANATTPKN